MASFLSPRDAAAVAGAMPFLMAEAEAMKNACVAPTAAQRRAVMRTILRVMSNKGRKAYGGYALNAAILAVSPQDAIYDAASPPPDVEFYSPDPVGDVVDICKRLHAEGHEYVQGKEAVHDGTFTVSVEFVRVCDISYMPLHAYLAVPSRIDATDGVRVVDPAFMMIDHLRMLCDPATSHWRLDRFFPRLCLLQRLFFPVLTPAAAGVPPALRDEDEAYAWRRARAWLAQRPSCVAVGHAAVAFFASVVVAPHPPSLSNLSRFAEASPTVVVSVDYRADVDGLLSACGALVRVVEHHPFTDLLGRRAVFYYSSSVGGGTTAEREIATVFDAADKRTVPVCGQAADGLQVASVSYTVMTAMATAFMHRAHLSLLEAEACDWVVARACELRSRFFDVTGTTVMDATPFADFVGLMHIGRVRSTMRVHMDATDRRMALHGRTREMAWLTYDPSKGAEHDAMMRRLRRSFLDCGGGPVREQEQEQAAEGKGDGDKGGSDKGGGGGRSRGARRGLRQEQAPEKIHGPY